MLEKQVYFFRAFTEWTDGNQAYVDSKGKPLDTQKSK